MLSSHDLLDVCGLENLEGLGTGPCTRGIYHRLVALGFDGGVVRLHLIHQVRQLDTMFGVPCPV